MSFRRRGAKEFHEAVFLQRSGEEDKEVAFTEEEKRERGGLVAKMREENTKAHKVEFSQSNSFNMKCYV